MIMEGAEPFFLPGGSRGVLLIHGFTGSPAEMRLYGEFLQQRGYTVLAPRLAGHGTSLQDMEHSTADDWLRSVLDAYAMLRDTVREVNVAGHSMGGLLALWLAASKPVARVVSLAAPIFIREARNLHLLPSREKARGMFLPKAPKSVPVEKQYRVCYRATPLLSIHELLDVIERSKAALPAVRSSLCVVQSERDHTVEPESARYLIDHVGSADKRLVWLKRSGHRLPIDIEREDVFRRTAEFLDDGLPPGAGPEEMKGDGAA